MFNKKIKELYNMLNNEFEQMILRSLKNCSSFRNDDYEYIEENHLYYKDEYCLNISKNYNNKYHIKGIDNIPIYDMMNKEALSNLGIQIFEIFDENYTLKQNEIIDDIIYFRAIDNIVNIIFLEELEE